MPLDYEYELKQIQEHGKTTMLETFNVLAKEDPISSSLIIGSFMLGISIAQSLNDIARSLNEQTEMLKRNYPNVS